MITEMGLIPHTGTLRLSLARAVFSRTEEFAQTDLETAFGGIKGFYSRRGDDDVHIHRRENLFTPYPPSEDLQSADMRNPSPTVGRREHMTNRGSAVRLKISRPLVPVAVGDVSVIAAAAIGLSGASPSGGQPNTTRSTSARHSSGIWRTGSLSTTAFVNRALCTSVG